MPTAISFLSFVFAIVQQPVGWFSFVSPDPSVLTQYQGGEVMRLMAHDNMAGEPFAQLKDGDAITIIYPDRAKRFAVGKMLRYKFLFPIGADPPPDTVSFLGEDGVGLSGRELYNLINDKSFGLVLQTCDGGPSGRLFVVAYPVIRAAERISR